MDGYVDYIDNLCWLFGLWQKLALLDLDYCDEIMTMVREMFPEKKIMYHLANIADRADLERTGCTSFQLLIL